MSHPECRRTNHQLGWICQRCDSLYDRDANERELVRPKQQEPLTWMQRDALHNANNANRRAERRLQAVRRGLNLKEARMLERGLPIVERKDQ